MQLQHAVVSGTLFETACGITERLGGVVAANRNPIFSQ